MNDLIETLRYDHPVAFKSSIGVMSLILVIATFLALPKTPLFEAIGVGAGQRKMEAAYYTIFWNARALVHTEAEATPVQMVFGSMVGIDHEGMLIISTPIGPAFVKRRVNIADVRVTDMYGAASLIQQMGGHDAKFEFYHNNEVVVWIKDAPFNVKLIEAGYAEPDPSPPTNIVDKAFAAYYERQLFGMSTNK